MPSTVLIPEDIVVNKTVKTHFSHGAYFLARKIDIK